MSGLRIESTESPQIVLSCHGDLQIQGWDELEIQVKGELSNFASPAPEEKTAPVDELSLQGVGDLQLKVPVGAQLHLKEVDGDLAVKNIDGSITVSSGSGDAVVRKIANLQINSLAGDLSARNIEGVVDLDQVMGDVALRNVHELKVGTVHGDLLASYVTGSITLKQVMGDVSLSTVNGDVTISSVHRDLNLRNLGGIVVGEGTSGDVRLLGGLSPGKHSLKAEGDIVLRWPVDSPVNIYATSTQITNQLPLDDEVAQENSLSGRIGDGETYLNLEAGGRIIMKDVQATKDYWNDDAHVDFDLGVNLAGLGSQIAEEINSRVSEWSSRLEGELGNKIAQRMEKRAQKAATRAEKAAERAVKQAEKAARKARWKGQATNWSAPAPPRTPAKPASSGPSQEEQLKILKMVENGVITPDEASSLLEAMGE